MKTVILKILTTPQAAAQLCVDLFGEGTANPEAPIVEEFIARCMSPPTPEGYTRVLITDEYVDGLQYLMDNYTSTDVEVISVETDGIQKRFVTSVDPQTGWDVELGYFAGYPIEVK